MRRRRRTLRTCWRAAPATCTTATILDCDEAAWDFSFDLNVKATYRVVRAVLPGMIERGGGSIVCIASVASSVKGVPVRCAYGASKAGEVIGLAKSVAADFIGRNVRCNAICPGTVQSPSLDERSAARGGGREVRRAFIDRQPMGRLGTPGEMAAIALHLAGDESAFTHRTDVRRRRRHDPVTCVRSQRLIPTVRRWRYGLQG